MRPVKLKPSTKIYPLDTSSLGTLAPIELKKEIHSRILFRDGNKSNLGDALIFLQQNKDSSYENNVVSRSVITKGIPFYLLPRTRYGKIIDYTAKTKVKTRSRSIGVLFNPYQLFFSLNTPRYIEPNFANRIKIGATYTWAFTTHSFKHLTYKRSTFSVGPYFMLGTTSISSLSLNSADEMLSGQLKNKPVFGISGGVIFDYAFNDFFGIGILAGHDRIYSKYKSDWYFHNNNISLGFVFAFKLSRI